MRVNRRIDTATKLTVVGTEHIRNEVLSKLPKTICLHMMGHMIDVRIERSHSADQFQENSSHILLALESEEVGRVETHRPLLMVALEPSDQWILADVTQLTLKLESDLTRLLPFNTLLQVHAKNACLKLHTPTHTALKYSSSIDASLLASDSSSSVPYFDSLIEPKGKLLESENVLTRLYKTNRTYYCTGGATLANVIAVATLSSGNGRFLVDRQCHQSIHRALKQCSAQVTYVEPKKQDHIGLAPLEPSEVHDLIISRSFDFFIYNACTYDGIIADNNALVELCQCNGMLVMADEAWLSHGVFSLCTSNALDARADIVIHSPHKMMGALSQGALLHSNLNGVWAEKLAETYKVFTTSSPSYPIIASVEYACVYYAIFGGGLAKQVRNLRRRLINHIDGSRFFRVRFDNLDDYQSKLDPFKLHIQMRESSLRGATIAKILYDEFNICAEKSTDSYITFILCPHLSYHDIDEIAHAFEAIERRLESSDSDSSSQATGIQLFGGLVKVANDGITLPFAGATAVSTREIILYPPGIPLFLAGEVVSAANLNNLSQAVASQFVAVHGLVEFNNALCMAVTEGS
jgi:arginine decarboxylase